MLRSLRCKTHSDCAQCQRLSAVMPRTAPFVPASASRPARDRRDRRAQPGASLPDRPGPAVSREHILSVPRRTPRPRASNAAPATLGPGFRRGTVIPRSVRPERRRRTCSEHSACDTHFDCAQCQRLLAVTPRTAPSAPASASRPARDRRGRRARPGASHRNRPESAISREAYLLRSPAHAGAQSFKRSACDSGPRLSPGNSHSSIRSS